MDCRIIRVEQGSDEWLALRRSRITASRLGDVMAKPDTKRYQQYRREKVLELLGNENVEEAPEWARHGRENEDKAIAGYEYKYAVDVEHDVFMISSQYDWLAASPDMLQLAPEADEEFDQGAEVKCRALYKNYKLERQRAIDKKGTTGACPACDRHQVQGNIWVSGWRYWWYVNYYIGDDLEGGMVNKIHRVGIPRDQKLIDEMEVRCLKFMKECYELAGL
jgi:hypothetical protein